MYDGSKLSMHFLPEWKDDPSNLRVGATVMVNYCPYPNGGRVYSRKEKVVQINDVGFTTQLDSHDFFGVPCGYPLGVFPRTKYNEECVRMSDKSLRFQEELRRTSVSPSSYLPEDYDEVLVHLRALQDLERNRALNDEEILRQRRIMWWDIAARCGQTDSFRFNNPHNEDWKLHPDDSDFKNGRLCTFFDGESRLVTECRKETEGEESHETVCFKNQACSFE